MPQLLAFYLIEYDRFERKKTLALEEQLGTRDPKQEKHTTLF